jgi:hypothetical protein
MSEPESLTHPATDHRRWLLAVAMFVAGLLLINQGRQTGSGQLASLITGLMSALPAVLLWWAAAVGFGEIASAALRLGQTPTSVRLTLGAGLQLMLLWLIGVMFGLFPALGYIIIAVGLLAVVRLLRRKQFRIDERVVLPAISWPTVLIGLLAGMMTSAALIAPGVLWAPTEFGGYDALSYHLQLPREWMMDGRIAGYPHNVYSYLPNLVEVGFLHMGLISGGMREGAVAAQVWHVSWALLAAWLIATTIRRLRPGENSSGPALAAVLYLALPWTLVTATLAYTEQASNAFIAAAVLLALDGATLRPLRRGLLVGVCCGLAGMTKLTALAMFAPPLLVVLAIVIAGRRAKALSIIAALAGMAIVLLPFIVRNAIWTGNPVFPMLTDLFGTGHWTAEQAARWTAAHQPGLPIGERLSRLWTHWLADYQHGFVFWPAVLVGTGWWLIRGKAIASHRMLLGLVLLLIWPIGVWLTLTHLQARFLVPLFVPGCLVLGLMMTQPTIRVRRVTVIVGLLVASILGGLSINRWYQQPAQTALLTDGVQAFRQLPELSIAGLVNRLPPNTRVYAEGYATPFYIDRPISYHTVWDRSLLGDLLDLSGGDVGAALIELRRAGFTHLLIDRAMIDRWQSPGNYGFDPRITPAMLDRLPQLGLRPINMNSYGGKQLYDLRTLRPGRSQTN